MKKKYIIFDLDGTLLDTKRDLLYALNYVFAKHGLTTINEKDLLKHLGLGLRYLFDGCLKENLDSNIKDSIFNEFLEYYSKHLTVYTIPYKNVLETLKKLKEKGVKMAVVSNKKDEYVSYIINYYFNNIFDYTTGAKVGYKKKPNSDLVYLAISELNANIDETIYIGDSIYDLETARNSKLDSIIVSYGYADIEKLKVMNPDILIDDFKDILKYI